MLAFIMFDPMYFLILAPAMILAGWAQWRVKSAYHNAQKVRPVSGLTGAEAARRILSVHGVEGVGIEQAKSWLGDHYDPRHRVLRLSPEVYSGRDLAAVGIAAHEVGHALQHAHGYAPLSIRNAIVPLAATGSNLSMFIFIIGMFMSTGGSRNLDGSIIWGPGQYLMVAGLILFSTVVVFQLVNLPVEFDASKRAKYILVNQGIIAESERAPVAKVLNAAALTYVAATLSAILTLLYLLMRSGLLGGRRD
jgi:hypothetical protein